MHFRLFISQSDNFPMKLRIWRNAHPAAIISACRPIYFLGEIWSQSDKSRSRFRARSQRRLNSQIQISWILHLERLLISAIGPPPPLLLLRPRGNFAARMLGGGWQRAKTSCQIRKKAAVIRARKYSLLRVGGEMQMESLDWADTGATSTTPLVSPRSADRRERDGGRKRRRRRSRFDVSTGFPHGPSYSNNRDGRRERNVNGARSAPRTNNWTVWLVFRPPAIRLSCHRYLLYINAFPNTWTVIYTIPLRRSGRRRNCICTRIYISRDNNNSELKTRTVDLQHNSLARKSDGVCLTVVSRSVPKQCN